MEKRKIALISDWYPPKVGGIEYSMHALAKTLAMHGNDVSVITRSYPNFPEHCIIDGISIIRIQSKPFPGQSRFLMPNAYKQLYYLLKKGNYNNSCSLSIKYPRAESGIDGAAKNTLLKSN